MIAVLAAVEEAKDKKDEELAHCRLIDEWDNSAQIWFDLICEWLRPGSHLTFDASAMCVGTIGRRFHLFRIILIECIPPPGIVYFKRHFWEFCVGS